MYPAPHAIVIVDSAALTARRAAVLRPYKELPNSGDVRLSWREVFAAKEV